MIDTKEFSIILREKIVKLVLLQSVKPGNKWSGDQLQHAEDYIDALINGPKPGENQVQSPIELSSGNAVKIRDIFRAQRKLLRRKLKETAH